jgi:hypothetical protein
LVSVVICRMSTHFDDVKREVLSLPSKEREALADLLIKERDQAVDEDPEQFPLTSHVGPHDLVIAARYDKIINKNAYSIAGAAKETKKSKTVVRGYLRRLNELSGVALKASRDGKFCKSICDLILTIPDEKQRDKFAKEVLDGGQDGEPMSFRVAKQWKAEHYMKQLKGAPFPLDDATLDPEWGATCTKGSCKYWNGNTPERRQGKRANFCNNPPHYWELVRRNKVRTSARTKE